MNSLKCDQALLKDQAEELRNSSGVLDSSRGTQKPLIQTNKTNKCDSKILECNSTSTMSTVSQPESLAQMTQEQTAISSSANPETTRKNDNKISDMVRFGLYINSCENKSYDCDEAASNLMREAAEEEKKRMLMVPLITCNRNQTEGEEERVNDEADKEAVFAFKDVINEETKPSRQLERPELLNTEDTELLKHTPSAESGNLLSKSMPVEKLTCESEVVSSTKNNCIRYHSDVMIGDTAKHVHLPVNNMWFIKGQFCGERREKQLTLVDLDLCRFDWPISMQVKDSLPLIKRQFDFSSRLGLLLKNITANLRQDREIPKTSRCEDEAVFSSHSPLPDHGKDGDKKGRGLGKQANTEVAAEQRALLDKVDFQENCTPKVTLENQITVHSVSKEKYVRKAPISYWCNSKLDVAFKEQRYKIAEMTLPLTKKIDFESTSSEASRFSVNDKSLNDSIWSELSVDAKVIEKQVDIKSSQTVVSTLNEVAVPVLPPRPKSPAHFIRRNYVPPHASRLHERFLDENECHNDESLANALPPLSIADRAKLYILQNYFLEE